VILSACNTAAGGAEGAEALSGLARAFFYAGARALLVSHWAVASDATVKLITGAVGSMAIDKTIGRAEAIRHRQGRAPSGASRILGAVRRRRRGRGNQVRVVSAFSNDAAGPASNRVGALFANAALDRWHWA